MEKQTGRYLLWDQSSDKFFVYGDLSHAYGEAVFNEAAGTNNF